MVGSAVGAHLPIVTYALPEPIKRQYFRAVGFAWLSSASLTIIITCLLGVGMMHTQSLLVYKLDSQQLSLIQPCPWSFV